MNTVKRKLIIVACVLPLLFMACGKDDVDDTPYNNEPFTFLIVGNEWEYGIYSNDELINTTNLKIVSACDGALTNYKVIFDDDENKFVNWIFHKGMRRANMALVPWYIEFFSDTDAVFNHLAYSLYQDCYVGKQRNINNQIESGNAKANIEVLQEILSISETVITPAGKFYNCIKVKTTPLFGVFDNYAWYHKNYGIIMMQEGEVTYKLHSKNFNW